MNTRQVFALITLLLISGCGIGSGLSQKDMETLLSEAKVEAAARQFGEAEKKLLQCVQHSDKNSYVKLAALNQLVNVELQLHKDSRAKSLTKEAGADAEAISRALPEHSNSSDERLLQQARIAILRWADSYADVGSFDSARTLYRKAQIIEQRSVAKISPEDSAESRLTKLAEIARGEKTAIEHDDGLSNAKDPRFIARKQRTADRRRLMSEFGLLNDLMVRKPSKEIADKLLAILPRIRTAFGIREGEYRSALSTTVQWSFLYGQRDKALSLLKEDMALFDNITQAGIDRADPTTLENANFMIVDLAQYAGLMLQIANYKLAGDLANRGIKLAAQVHLIDSLPYADCLRVAAGALEHREKRSEALQLRERQIAMLKNLKLTENYPPYYDAHLELGRNLGATGQKEEGLRHLDYAIALLQAKQPNHVVLAYAYTAKAEILRTHGDNAGALRYLESARPIWETKGNHEQKYGCYRVLSKVLRSLHQLEEAHQMGLKSLQYCQKSPPDKQLVELPDCYHELALTEARMGKEDKAIANLKQAIEYQRKVSGENDFVHAGMLNFLATMETNKGNIAEAEKLRLRAVAACRKTKEPERAPLVSTLLQIANFYHNLNQLGKAEKFYRDALREGKVLKDADGIHYLRMARIQLGDVLVKSNRPEAEQLKKEAIAEAATSTNGIPLQDGYFYAALGDLCLNLQDYENGDQQYDRAEKIALANKPALRDLEILVLTRKRDLYKVTKREKLAQAVVQRLVRLQKPSAGR